MTDIEFTLFTFALGGAVGTVFGWLLGVTRYLGVR